MISVMLRKSCLFSLLAVCALQIAVADTIQLKEKASVTGTILAEKHDSVFVDVGYTVLTIPRGQIAKIVYGALTPGQGCPPDPTHVA